MSESTTPSDKGVPGPLPPGGPGNRAKCELCGLETNTLWYHIDDEFGARLCDACYESEFH